MRMLVFFDLPVKQKGQQREATRFRNFLIKDGFYMVQYSVYSRVCNGSEAVEKHLQRLKPWLPGEGSVRVLTVTEKQYQSMQLLLGKPLKNDEPFATEQLSFF